MDEPIARIPMLANSRRNRCQWPMGLTGFLCLLTSGCLSVDRDVGCAGEGCAPEYAHVEVLRGISGYWPTAGRFQDQLACRGVSSTVSWCELYPLVASRLIEKKRCHPHAPVVLAGYSLGANHVLRVSRRLQEQGIAVDGLVLLETTYDDTVPANVRRCFNVYKPRPLDEIPFMRGIPLEADSRWTRMTNYDCNVHDDGRYQGLNHLTISMDDDIHALLADAVAGMFVPDCFRPGYARISDGWYDAPPAEPPMMSVPQGE